MLLFTNLQMVIDVCGFACGDHDVGIEVLPDRSRKAPSSEGVNRTERRQPSKTSDHRLHSRYAGCASVLTIFSEQFAHAVEPPFPNSAVVANPLLQCVETLAGDHARAHPADFLRVHKPTCLKDFQVLRDRRQRDAQRRRELRHGERPFREPVENGPSCTVAQRMEKPIRVDVFGNTQLLSVPTS